MRPSSPTLIEVPTRADARGALSFLEEGNGLPFAVKRIFYMHGIPPGAERGAHAHRKLEQLLIAISGSFEVKLEGHAGEHAFSLDRPDRALYVPPMTWTEVRNFSPGAVCVVLASDRYDESDYLRERAAFLRELGR